MRLPQPRCRTIRHRGFRFLRPAIEAPVAISAPKKISPTTYLTRCGGRLCNESCNRHGNLRIPTTLLGGYGCLLRIFCLNLHDCMNMKKVATILLATAAVLLASCSEDSDGILSRQQTSMASYLGSTHSPRLIPESELDSSLEENPQYYSVFGNSRQQPNRSKRTQHNQHVRRGSRPAHRSRVGR